MFYVFLNTSKLSSNSSNQEDNRSKHNIFTARTHEKLLPAEEHFAERFTRVLEENGNNEYNALRIHLGPRPDPKIALHPSSSSDR